MKELRIQYMCGGTSHKEQMDYNMPTASLFYDENMKIVIVSIDNPLDDMGALTEFKNVAENNEVILEEPYNVGEHPTVDTYPIKNQFGLIRLEDFVFID